MKIYDVLKGMLARDTRTPYQRFCQEQREGEAARALRNQRALFDRVNAYQLGLNEESVETEYVYEDGRALSRDAYALLDCLKTKGDMRYYRPGDDWSQYVLLYPSHFWEGDNKRDAVILRLRYDDANQWCAALPNERAAVAHCTELLDNADLPLFWTTLGE